MKKVLIVIGAIFFGITIGLLLWKPVKTARKGLHGPLKLVTNNYYVRNDGANGNNGLTNSAGGAWHDINYALSHATLTGGTIIHVQAGTYNESAGCDGNTPVVCVSQSGQSTTNRLTLQCDQQWSVPSGAGCLLRNNGGSNGAVETSGNNIDVIGFDYSNAAANFGMFAHCNPSGSTCPDGNSVHFINNYLHDIGQTYNDNQGGVGCPSAGAIMAGPSSHGTGASLSDLQLINNRVSNFGLQSRAPRNGGTGCNFAHGFYISTGNVIMYNNVIIQAIIYGIQFYSAPCNGVIANNTIDQPGKAGIVLGGGDCATPGRITVINNIFETTRGIDLGASGVAPCTSSSRILISNNLIPSGLALTNGNTNGCTDISGTKTESPTSTFNSYSGASTNNSYTIQPSSLAVRGGTTACVSGGISPCTPTTDIVGATRPSPPSIGAYDITSVPPPPGLNNYYVSASGNDTTGSGSQSSPWATISKAIGSFALATNGVVIHVADGTYANTTINRGGGSTSQRLVVQCDNGVANAAAAQGHCKISGSGLAGFQLTGGNNFDIKGFDIGNNPNMQTAIDGIPCGTASVSSPAASSCLNSIHIIGNNIHDLSQNVAVDANGCNVPGNGPAAILLPNQHYFRVTDPQIIGNIVKNYGPLNYPITCAQSNYAIYIDTPGALVYNNLFYGKGAFGAQIYGDPCNLMFSNNTIIGFQYAVTLSGGGEGNCTPGVVTFANNIMAGQTKGEFIGISSMPCTDAAHQSLFANNISDGLHPDFNSIGTNLSCNTTTPGTGSPGAFIHASGASLFVNYQSDGTGDYHLKSGSPATDAGTNQCVTGGASPCVPTFDILNSSRGAAPSIGAYEASGGPVSVITLSPTSFAYGNVPVGGQLDQTFVVTNNNVSTVTVSSANAIGSGYTVNSNGCSTLSVNATCNIVVRFAPTASGPVGGSLTINHTASNSPLTVPLSGSGTQAIALVNPPSVTFAPQTVGVLGTAPIGFSDLFNTGTLNSSLWTVDIGQAPGNITGVNSGSLSANNVDMSQNVLAMKVTQAGTAPTTSIGAEVRSLGTYGFGTYAATFRAASTATTPLGAGVTASGQISSAFEFINNSQTEIDVPEIEGRTPNVLEWTNFKGVGSSQFTSTTPGFQPDQAFHTYSALWTPTLITFFVDGNQVSTHNLNIPIAPTFAMFNLWGTNSNSFGGTATAGTRWMYVSKFSYTPLSNVVYVFNTGSGPMTFSSPPSANGDFSVTATTCPVSPATLASGANCTVTVAFTPTISGPRTGSLTIASNAAGSPTLIPLSGTGQGVAPAAPTGQVLTSGVIGVH